MTYDNTLSIRKATTADASEISNLIISSLRQTNAQDYSPDIIDRVVNNFTPEKVTELIKSRQVFIASHHNHIIGTVSLDSTNIRSLFVHPEKQHCGFGFALMQYIENIAKKQGVDCLTVPSSVTAEGFYKKLGYMALRDEHYGTERTIIMEKSIKAPSQTNNVEVVTTIETDRLALRCPEKRHNEYLANLWRDKKVREYLGGVLSGKEIEDKITLLHKHWKIHNFGFWVVLDKTSEQIVGLCGLSWEDSSLELSYMFFSQYWGQGIAQEAAKATLVHGFKQTGEKEIICITQKENTRSCKLLKKLGMKHVKNFERFNSIQSLFSIKHHLENTEMGKLL